MKTDIYAPEHIDQHHSLRYIHATVRNVVGILNRIASLMRKKRYNMEEVSVSFADSGELAYILIAIDAKNTDINQVIQQVHKLHDVLDVYDCSQERELLYNAIYVTAKTRLELDQFLFKPVFVVKDGPRFKGIYSVHLDKTPAFLKNVIRKKYHYVRRIVSLID